MWIVTGAMWDVAGATWIDTSFVLVVAGTKGAVIASIWTVEAFK